MYILTLPASYSPEASLGNTAVTHPGCPILDTLWPLGNAPASPLSPAPPPPAKFNVASFPLRRLRPSALCFLKSPPRPPANLLHISHLSPVSLWLTSLPGSGTPLPISSGILPFITPFRVLSSLEDFFFFQFEPFAFSSLKNKTSHTYLASSSSYQLTSQPPLTALI